MRWMGWLTASITVSLCFISTTSHAHIYTYTLDDKAEFTLLDTGPQVANGAVKGEAVINDTGNGTPTLTSLLIHVNWSGTFSGPNIDAATGIAGSSVAIDFDDTLGPIPNQTGTGSVSTQINWGPLTGFSQTGHLICTTTCPGGCNGASACQVAFGFESPPAGPPPPLTSSSYNLDPWTFSVTTFDFTGPISGTTFWFIPGSIHFAGTAFLHGVRTVIPAVDTWGVSALAGLLLAAGALWLWQRRRPA